MPDHVLVPLDGSPQSWDALEHAFAKHPDGDVTLLTVIDPIEAGASRRTVLPGAAGEWYEAEQDAAGERFEEALDRAPAGATVQTTVELGRPARVIIEYARDHDVDHIVIGSHGRSGVSRILLGSVAETVVRRSPIPVTVVR